MKLNYRPFLILGLCVLGTSAVFAQTTVVVNIDNWQYLPKTQVVDIVDQVKWVNLHSQTHDVTEDNFSWNSPAMPKNATFTQVFDKPGKFSYYCSFHPGMRGEILVRTAENTKIQIGKDIIRKTPKILPIKLNLAGKNANQAYLGSYIVNAQGGCADCHSCPTYVAGHDPFQGETKQLNATTYLAGGRAFGPFVSANLTPDSAGKPAGLTLEQFKNLMRTGQDPHVPGNTLQVMPWPAYGLMSDYDLEAVYTYLSSIPTAKQPSASACK